MASHATTDFPPDLLTIPAPPSAETTAHRAHLRATVGATVMFLLALVVLAATAASLLPASSPGLPMADWPAGAL